MWRPVVAPAGSSRPLDRSNQSNPSPSNFQQMSPASYLPSPASYPSSPASYPPSSTLIQSLSTPVPPAGRPPMPLTDATLKSLRVSRTFNESSATINHIDFSPTGDKLITSAADDVIVVYDCHKGSVNKIINSKKYGAENAIFHHSNHAALHSGNKLDDNIRYLNLQENKYIAAFAGHQKKILQIALSPVDDIFISSSADRSLRIWDHRQGCVGLISGLGPAPSICFDPEGLIFAVGTCEDKEQRILLYDTKNYGEGPFNVFRYPEELGADWRSLKMSNDGKYLLVCTNAFVCYVMDAYGGQCLFALRGHANRGYALEASFTPDSNYVIVGSTDGKMNVWSMRTGEKVETLVGKNPDSAICVKFSPHDMLLASAGTRVSFWLPQI